MGMNLNLMKEVIDNFGKNNYFIETGTFLGECCNFAISCGYNNIKSVEYIRERYENALQNFKYNNNIEFYFGKSEEQLEKMISEIDDSCTFWLDAHDDYYCPALKELEVIKQHSFKYKKDHLIMIDDIRAFDSPIHENIRHLDLKNKILEINENYNFYYSDSVHALNDILIATTKKLSGNTGLIKSEFNGIIFI